MNLALWQARFREYLEVRSYSARTVEGYVAELRPFFDFLAAVGIEELGRVTRQAVEEYRSHLFHRRFRGRRISPNTQAGYLCHLRLFFEFLTREGFLAVDPAQCVELPRTQPHLPRTILSEQEAERVMEAAAGKDPLGIRNRAILEVLYGTAIRNQELRELTLDDLSLEEARLTVRRGKGSKTRLLPLGDEAMAWLREYLDKARPHFIRAPGERLLFLSWRGRQLRRNTLSKLVRALARQAGIKKPVTPHVLRHCCATHMLRRGAGLRHLQELLGHESPQTTQRYTRLEVSDLRKVLERCHPREKKS